MCFGCHFPGPSLAGQGRSVHYLTVFICQQNCPHIPSKPPKQAFSLASPSTTLLSSSSLSTWAENLRAKLSIPPDGARASGFSGDTGKGGTTPWDALSSRSTRAEATKLLEGNPDNNPHMHKRLWGPKRVLLLMLMPVPPLALLGALCQHIITNEILTVTANQEVEYSD